MNRLLRLWRLVGGVLSLLALNGMAAGGPRVLYETHFEPAEGFDEQLTLIGQGGWIGQGSGGNGLITNFFVGEGQHAFIGFTAPTNQEDFLNLWVPINYLPGPTNPPIVRFSVLFSIEDSSTTNRDAFRWSFYNIDADRLFSIDLGNDTLTVGYLLDDGVYVPTAAVFTNSVNYQLETVVDFGRNRWSATLNGATLFTNLLVTTRGAALNLGDVDAVWSILDAAKPGDNFMVFDNVRIAAEGARTNPPPRLQALGLLRPGEFLVRCFGIPSVSYVLEATPDFENWLPLKTNVVPADGYFDHLDQNQSGARYYRMAELPSAQIAASNVRTGTSSR